VRSTDLSVLNRGRRQRIAQPVSNCGIQTRRHSKVGTLLWNSSFVASYKLWGFSMPQGDNSACNDKSSRSPRSSIEEGYEHRGPEKEAESRAWVAVNKESSGGNKSGSGRGRAHNHHWKKRGTRAVRPQRTTEERSSSAKKLMRLENAMSITPIIDPQRAP
jgi:hypothetical protein